MSVGRFASYHPDGRMRGSFVYMLLCQDDGPIYVKVGETSTPSERLTGLRTGCPFMPQVFALLEVPSKSHARLIELELHRAFEAWHSHGEWFRVTVGQRRDFNAAWKPVLTRYSTASWPLKWLSIAVEPVVRDARRRSNYKRFQFARINGESGRQKPPVAKNRENCVS